MKLVFHCFTSTTFKLPSHAVVQVTCRVLRDTNLHQARLLVSLTNAHAVKEEAFSCPGLSRLSDIPREVTMKRSFFKTLFKVRAVNQGLRALIREGRNHLKSGSCSIWKSWNWNERIFCQLVSHPQLAIHKGLEEELNPFFSRNNYFCDYHIDSMSYTLVLSRQAGSCMRGGKRENDWDEITTNSYCRQEGSVGSQPQYFCNLVWMGLMGCRNVTYTEQGTWKAVWHGALFQRKNTDSFQALIAFILLVLLLGIRLPSIKWD